MGKAKTIKNSIVKKYNLSSERYNVAENFYLNKQQAIKFIQELKAKSDFMSLINIFQVYHPEWEKLVSDKGVKVTGRQFESRNTAVIERNGERYKLAETDSGVFITWDLLDHITNYEEAPLTFYEDFANTQIISDMLKIGWHGESLADNTTQINLSDVNKGWLTLLAEQRPQNMIQSGTETNKIKIFGEGADFKKLEKLALALRNKLAEQHRDRNDLVFLVGAELLSREPSNIIELSGEKTTNDLLLSNYYLANNFGGMRVITPPNFPTKCAAVTSFKNLSIYTVGESHRRSMYDDEDNKGYVHRYYRTEGYVVEDLGLISAINYKHVILGE